MPGSAAMDISMMWTSRKLSDAVNNIHTSRLGCISMISCIKGYYCQMGIEAERDVSESPSSSAQQVNFIKLPMPCMRFRLTKTCSMQTRVMTSICSIVCKWQVIPHTTAESYWIWAIMMSVSPVSYKSHASAASVVILHLSLDGGRMVAGLRSQTFDSKSGASNFDLLCKFGKLPCQWC